MLVLSKWRNPESFLSGTSDYVDGNIGNSIYVLLDFLSMPLRLALMEPKPELIEIDEGPMEDGQSLLKSVLKESNYPDRIRLEEIIQKHVPQFKRSA